MPRPPDDAVRPTFIIAGALRSGTTSLSLWLMQHPQVFMPYRKELHYFEHAHQHKIHRWDEYLAHFEPGQGGRRGSQPVLPHEAGAMRCQWKTDGPNPENAWYPAARMTPPSVAACVEAYRNGEDPDLGRLLQTLWRELYAQVPRLTGSRRKEDQHRILEDHLVSLGLPAAPDLQYVAGPVLWYAREKGVVPPAQVGDAAEAWTLDERKYEAARATLGEGLTAYGDWMRDALRTLLSEQQ